MLMFGEPLLSHPRRCGLARHRFSEFVATFGLVAVIWGCSRQRASAVALAVGAYITAAYWFTASTSFANPAVTLARAATDTFAGIRPADVPAVHRRAVVRRLRGDCPVPLAGALAPGSASSGPHDEARKP